MGDYIRDFVFKLASDNWTTLAWIGAAVAAAGAGFGVLTKLVAWMFKASLSGGEAAAKLMGEKPKGVAVFLAVFAMFVTGLWAWHRFTAPKIVEKIVVQEVPVREFVQPDMKQVEAERVAAERRVVEAKNAAAAADIARMEAESRAADLASKVKAISPPEGDKEALENLSKQLDTLHMDGVLGEMDRPGFDYRRYRAYRHENAPDSMTHRNESLYHRGCKVCDANFNAEVKMDEIYKRQRREEVMVMEQERRQKANDLLAQMDVEHQNRVTVEAKAANYDSSKYREVREAARGKNTWDFHQSCETCDKNGRIIYEIYRLRKRFPETFKDWRFEGR
jgi:hypothetical protein